MTTQDRLLALAVQLPPAGAAADDGSLVDRLAGQAPDLTNEIRALLAAMDRVGADRAIDPTRLAQEIAASLRLPLATVVPAAEVALLLGGRRPAVPPSTPAASHDGWAGDSVLAPPPPVAPPPVTPPPVAPSPVVPPIQYPPHQPTRPAWVADAFPPPPAAPKPWEQLWFYGVIAAVLIGAAVLYMRTYGAAPSKIPEQIATPAPTPTPSASAVPDDADAESLEPGGPALATGTAALPMLTVRRAASGALGLGFSVNDQDGPVQGLVVLPAGGWDTGESTIIGQRGAASSIGSGRFVRGRIGTVPMRVLKPVWRQDGLDIGPACVLVGGQPGAPDVALQGAKICVADVECGQPVGCGVLP